jgi:hypothetical protein
VDDYNWSATFRGLWKNGVTVERLNIAYNPDSVLSMQGLAGKSVLYIGPAIGQHLAIENTVSCF